MKIKKAITSIIAIALSMVTLSQAVPFNLWKVAVEEYRHCRKKEIRLEESSSRASILEEIISRRKFNQQRKKRFSLFTEQSVFRCRKLTRMMMYSRNLEHIIHQEFLNVKTFFKKSCKIIV